MQNSRNVYPIELAGRPPRIDECFQALQAAGAVNFALFGGAVRDADYAAYHTEPREINDYDIRIWLPEDNHLERTHQFIKKLCALTRSDVRMVPSPGTGRMRYLFDFSGIEMDVSIRPEPSDAAIPQDVGIERAGDSDIGLCSVAIAANSQAWGTKEYLNDRNNRTLSVYPNADSERMAQYVERMQQKFPDHKVIYLK